MSCCKKVIISNEVVDNLRLADALDADGFNGGKSIELFSEIHAPDVLVTYPNGQQTKGIVDHLIKINELYTISPDIRVSIHPTALGHDSMTNMIGILEGTVGPNAVSLIPEAKEGNRFRIRMNTLNFWNKDVGSFKAETLFYDNYTFIKEVIDPNPPEVLPAAVFDTFNITQANYFKIPYHLCEVENNLCHLQRFYRYVNSRRWDKVATMINVKVSFVNASSVYHRGSDQLVAYLQSLRLPTSTPYEIITMKWDTSKALYGAKDWVTSAGVLQISTTTASTVPSSTPPAIYPESYPSPIPLMIMTRWYGCQIHEFHIFFDQLEVMTQLELTPIY